MHYSNIWLLVMLSPLVQVLPAWVKGCRLTIKRTTKCTSGFIVLAACFSWFSTTHTPFLWCYPDKSPAAVSVTSHSHTKTSCCLVTAQTIVSSHNTMGLCRRVVCQSRLRSSDKGCSFLSIFAWIWIRFFFCFIFYNYIFEVSYRV